MATPRDVRRLALLLIYQLDAHPDTGPDELLASIDDLDGLVEEGLTLPDGVKHVEDRDKRKALELATDAFAHRASADDLMTQLAPEWPTSRQAAVDRAILRLAHHEIRSGVTPPKAAVNEAVELAKSFSTEKSPAFINGLLGKALKRIEPPAPIESTGTDD